MNEEPSCQNCQNRCMDMDLTPYCAVVNVPWGQALHRETPKECLGEDGKRRLWVLDQRGTR